MPLSKNEHQICREPKNQHKTASSSKTKTHSTSTISSNNSPSESRNTYTKTPKSKDKLLLAKLKVLGCKEASASLPVSALAVIPSAAEWEAKHTRNRNLQRRKKPSHNPRNPSNVVDVPSVCCTPPGVGIASDFASRTRNTDRRIDHKKYSQAGRRNEDDSGPKTPASGIGSRADKRSPRRIIEMMMFQQNLLSERINHGSESDRYEDWRLNIDDMSYEELLDLSDRIGHVGTGLKEEEISNCLRKFKNLNSNSTLLLKSSEKDWKCSICQEKCSEAADIGILDCGHHHHLQCIKQWLLLKNACPVCKSTAIAHK